jgi:hypothetical protein
MNEKTPSSGIEFALYISVFVLGILCIVGSYCIRLITTDPFPFYYNLLSGLGTNMVVVTIVFGIYKFFSGKSKIPEELREKLADRASPAPKKTKRDYTDVRPKRKIT